MKKSTKVLLTIASLLGTASQIPGVQELLSGLVANHPNLSFIGIFGAIAAALMHKPQVSVPEPPVSQ